MIPFVSSPAKAEPKSQTKPIVMAEILDDDLFFITDSTESSGETLQTRQALILLAILVHRSSYKTNIFANENQKLKVLAEWLGPYPSFFLPYREPIPILFKSYALWQIGAATGVPPAKLWPLVYEAMLVAEKINVDKKLQNC